MRFSAFVALVLGIGSPASAHEFWIAPQAYQVEAGDPLTADIRVGESFKGNAYSYIERRTERFEVVQGDLMIDPEATLGDRPVLSRAVETSGLAVVVYETDDSQLRYREWQKFVNFVEHKDFSGALERHLERGLPETGFRETYRRYAKSLISVGDGAGSDREVGLDTEITALANPYTDVLSAGLPVRITLYGQPRANAQLEVYSRVPGGNASVEIVRTDADGIAVVPVVPGREYMLDAVVLEERDEDDTAWHSMWANLTFAVPE